MKKEAKKRLYESTLELLKESDYENLTIGKICHMSIPLMEDHSLR